MNKHAKYNENYSVPSNRSGNERFVPMAGDGRVAEAAALPGRRKAYPARRVDRWLRGCGAVAAVGAVLYGYFATSLGDRALAAMTQTFRIQQMVGIEMTAADLSALADKLEQGALSGRTQGIAQYGTVSQTGGGPAREVTPAEAGKLLGFPLPAPADAVPMWQYKPATTVTLKLNVDAVNRLIQLLGGTSLLPKAADGKSIAIDIPAGVYAPIASGSGAGIAHIAKFGAPRLTAEDGIDPDAIRKAVLELPVLPESVRLQLAAISDWRNTLPVPNVEGVTRTVSLNGSDAVLGLLDGERFVLWLEGGQLTMLRGDAAAFPSDDAIIALAKERIAP